MLAPTPLLRPSPMDVSALFTGAFAVMRQRLLLFLILALVPSLLMIVVVLGSGALFLNSLSRVRFTGDLSSLFVAPGVMLVGILFGVLVQLKSQGMMAQAGYEIAQGQRPDLLGLLTRTRGFLPRMAVVIGLFLTSILVFYGILVGLVFAIVSASSSSDNPPIGAVLGMFALILLVIPVAVFLSVKLLYIVPAVALEGRGGLESIKRSWRLTDGGFWRTLGYSLLPSLVVGVASYIVSSITQLAIPSAAMFAPGRFREPDSPEDILAMIGVFAPMLAVSMLLQLVVDLFSRPFLQIYNTIMFIDQVARSERPAEPFGYAHGYPGQGFPPGPPQPGPWGAQPPPPGGWGQQHWSAQPQPGAWGAHPGQTPPPPNANGWAPHNPPPQQNPWQHQQPPAHGQGWPPAGPPQQ